MLQSPELDTALLMWPQQGHPTWWLHGAAALGDEREREARRGGHKQEFCVPRETCHLRMWASVPAQHGMSGPRCWRCKIRPRRSPFAALFLGQWLPGEIPHSHHSEASQPCPSPLARLPWPQPALPTGYLLVPGSLVRFLL